MQEPKISFSPWTRWRERTTLEGIQLPGLYVLAHFETPPSGPADPQAQQIIYVGETCDNSLIGRWREFERSPFNGKDGHSGGRTYHTHFGARGEELYVSALPVGEFNEEL